MEELVKFCVCDNIDAIDAPYPDTEFFRNISENGFEYNGEHLLFADIDWCNENKICVNCKLIDKNTATEFWAYNVVAPKTWVMENCPEIIDSEWDFDSPNFLVGNLFFNEFPEYEITEE